VRKKFLTKTKNRNNYGWLNFFTKLDIKLEGRRQSFLIKIVAGKGKVYLRTGREGPEGE
jgi:hypothetical protein